MPLGRPSNVFHTAEGAVWSGARWPVHLDASGTPAHHRVPCPPAYFLARWRKKIARARTHGAADGTYMSPAHIFSAAGRTCPRWYNVYVRRRGPMHPGSPAVTSASVDDERARFQVLSTCEGQGMGRARVGWGIHGGGDASVGRQRGSRCSLNFEKKRRQHFEFFYGVSMVRIRRMQKFQGNIS